MCVDDLHYNSTCLDVYDDFEWVCPNYRKAIVPYPRALMDRIGLLQYLVETMVEELSGP